MNTEEHMSTQAPGRKRTRAAVVVAAVAFGLAACGRDETPPVSPTPPPVTTTPAPEQPIGMTGAPATADGTAPGMTIGTSAVGDAAVTAKVKAALMADADVRGLAIEVETKDGVVSLVGKVTGVAERDKALQIARGVEGVRSVSDGLAIN